MCACKLRCGTACLSRGLLLQHHGTARESDLTQRLPPWGAKGERGLTALRWVAQGDFSSGDMLKGRSLLLLETGPSPWLTPSSGPVSANKCTFWLITPHFHPRRCQAAPPRRQTQSLWRLGGEVRPGWGGPTGPERCQLGSVTFAIAATVHGDAASAVCAWGSSDRSCNIGGAQLPHSRLCQEHKLDRNPPGRALSCSRSG